MTKNKKHLAGKKFDDDDEVQEEVMLVQRAGGRLLLPGIQKLVPRLNKCFDNAGDYVEK